MKKKFINIMLCLMMISQSAVTACAEEFIVYDEGTEAIEEVVLDEALDSSVESSGEDLIVDEGLLEDASPEVSEGDGVTAGELVESNPVESETDEAETPVSEGETQVTDGETELDEAEGETEASQEIQETEVSSEEAFNNGAGAEKTEENEESSTEELLQEDVETETEGLLEDELDEDLETILLVETVELADETVFSNGSSGMARTFSLARYDGCFGNQLSGFALELYHERVAYYATNQNTGNMVIERTAATSPYTFEATVYTDSAGGHISKETTEYTEFYDQIKYDMQSSIDAFLYDHPEVFWLRSGSYEVTIAATGSASAGYVGYLKNITYVPTVAYPGAASQIFQYESGVASAVSQVMTSADKDGNGQLTNLELIKAIHDYLCERLYYDNAAYSAYLAKETAGQANDDYRIFCSAGAFLDSVGVGVVCEGYAKGFKVLCDRMNISCVLIGGKVQQSSGVEGHMWNGVKINGKWYLMDVTWDDSSSGYSYKYFLVGNITDVRASTGNFMGADLTTTFVYPTLETEAYENVNDVIHTITETKVVDPTCIDGGYTDHLCTDEGCEYFYRDTYTPPDGENHLYRYVITAPTCTKQGYTTVVCRLCGASYIDDSSYTEKLGHSYKKVTTVPTCTAQGYTTYTCTRSGCGYSYKADYTAIDSNNHNYKVSKVVEATCTAQGYTTHTCSRCGNSYNDTFVAAEGHDYKSVVTAPTCKAGGYTTYTCTRTGCGYSYQGDKKSKLTYHSYKNGTCIWCGTGDTITKATISKIANQGYDPKGVKPAITVKFGTNVLKEGTDYKVTYRNNTERGTAWATITGIGKYRGTVSREFKIIKRIVAKLTFSSAANKTYTGKAQKPTVTIRNNGTKLKKNTDYTITYSKNKNIGQAVITIKLKGNYSGTKKIYFNILPKAASVKTAKSTAKGKMKVTWKKVSGGSSYQVQYSLNSNFSGAKTVTVSSASSSKTISKLTSKKTYYVRIRSYKKVSGKQYYSAWSKSKKVTIK